MSIVEKAFAGLADHFAKSAPKDMRAAFRDDPRRFERYSARFDDLLLDFSKCRINETTMSLLSELAKVSGVEKLRDRMFAGEAINVTESRPVLHVALRNRSNRPIKVGGKDVMPEVNGVLERMRAFANQLRDGKRFTDVVNIGIGGSDLGPAMATLALRPYHDGPRLHFVSNVDSAHLADTIAGLDPATTMFIVASKTFTTIETMTNAHSARAWIAKNVGEKAVAEHFAAISTATGKVKTFGIGADRTFGFWDWVGGRYSVWSAIGLPVMVAVGPENFDKFLAGAHAMDEHFRSAPIGENLPILLGLLGVWHRNVCSHATRAVIPYDQRLARLPAYLQQLDMESNGKSVTREGQPTMGQTGPIVWGEPGTNGQHAFFQLIHQGTTPVPVEFLIAAQGHESDLSAHHDLLIANCLAQSQALMRGRSEEEASAPYRIFSGNRPSITIAYRKLDPHTLGRLIALYEHRVFVEAAIWNINAFDQWGVELGKELATGLLPAVQGNTASGDQDSSTSGLVAHLRKLAR